MAFDTPEYADSDRDWFDKLDHETGECDPGRCAWHKEEQLDKEEKT